MPTFAARDPGTTALMRAGLRLARDMARPKQDCVAKKTPIYSKQRRIAASSSNWLRSVTTKTSCTLLPLRATNL